MTRPVSAGGRAGDSRFRPDQIAPAAAALMLLFSGMWVANQGGVVPENPGNFAAMVQVLASGLPVALALVLGAAGIGAELRYRLLPTSSLGALQSAGLGLAALMLAIWLLGIAGLLNTLSAWSLSAVGAALAVRRLFDPDLRSRLYPDQWASPPWTLLPVLPVLGLILVAVACPPGTLWRVEAFGYDVGLYHLQLPREWLGAGAIVGLEHNVYSYFPNLVEAGYMAVFAMHGSADPSLITPQLVHAIMAVLAAVAVATIVARRSEAASAIVAAGMVLALPWVLITASKAYNEMAVLALGGIALATAIEPEGRTRRGAVLIGILLGAATLAKLTAGFLIALPVLLILLWQNVAPGNGSRVRRWWVTPAIAAVVAAMVVAPWLIRNAAWTGNPVFPMATSVFGTGHWNEELAERWDRGHMPSRAWLERFERLGSQWLFNSGYSAIGGREVGLTDEVSRFEREWGVPVFWLAAALAAGGLLYRRPWRRLVAMMGLVLAVQALFWLLLSHHQARFMVPTVLPGAVLAGWGLGLLQELVRPRMPSVYPVVTVGLLAVMGVHAFAVFLNDGPRSTRDPQSGQQIRLAPWQLIDNMERVMHPVDPYLPDGARVYMVADVQQLFHLQAAAIYESPWDRSLLGELIREHDSNPQAVTAALVERGVTHVWLGLSEMNRLRGTYGHDADVTPDSLRFIASGAGWSVVEDLQEQHGGVLLELPQRHAPSPQQPAPSPGPEHAPRQPSPRPPAQPSQPPTPQPPPITPEAPEQARL